MKRPITKRKRAIDPRYVAVKRLALRPGTEGERVAAEAALVRLEARSLADAAPGRPAAKPKAQPKRKIKSRLVIATCQFPDDEGLHTFEYTRTTKPRVYCDRHRDGWLAEVVVDGVETGEFERHGGERNVRVIRDDGTGKVIGRALRFEKHEPIENVTGWLRRMGARWLQRLGLPMIGDIRPDPTGPEPLQPGERDRNFVPPRDRLEYDWVATKKAGIDPETGDVTYRWIAVKDTRTHEDGPTGDPFAWTEIDRIESSGLQGSVVATTSVIAFDEDGRPRFDPGLVRRMTTESISGEKPTLSLDKVIGTNEDGSLNGEAFTLLAVLGHEHATAQDMLGSVQHFAEAVPGVLLDPPQRPALLPNAVRRLEVAFAQWLVKRHRAPQWAKDRVRELRQTDPKLAAAIERKVAEARETALWLETTRNAEDRVSPVLISDGTSRPADNRKDRQS
jgi:hypothetical protein